MLAPFKLSMVPFHGQAVSFWDALGSIPAFGMKPPQKFIAPNQGCVVLCMYIYIYIWAWVDKRVWIVPRWSGRLERPLSQNVFSARLERSAWNQDDHFIYDLNCAGCTDLFFFLGNMAVNGHCPWIPWNWSGTVWNEVWNGMAKFFPNSRDHPASYFVVQSNTL